MLHWAEVKRLIARLMGPYLAAIGFQNPGRASRRFRPTFVDVIWFECRRQGCFQLEFACGVRDFLPNNPAPWDCPFRTMPAYSFGWDEVDWHFRAAAAEQAAMLEDLAPRVVEAASLWFGYFTTVESAVHALNGNEWSGPRHVCALCREVLRMSKL